MFVSWSFILAQVYWRAPQHWPMAAICAAVLLAAVVWLYPAQLGQVRWPWRALLPTLRVLAVGVLAASLLKPVVMRLATAEEQGAVLMLIDRSKSMGVVDNSRSTAQLVALADALGKLPPKTRSDAGTALAAELERLGATASDVRAAQEDLDYARVSGRDIEFRRKRLSEVALRYSRSSASLLGKAGSLSGADDLVRKIADLARPPDPDARQAWRVTVPEQIAAAATAVADFQDNVDAELYESNDEVRQACDAVATMSRFSLVEAALLRPGGVVATARQEAAVKGFSLAADVAPLELVHANQVVRSLNTAPDGDESDLTAGIARAVSAQPVRAVVLFSDGRQVGGDATIVSGLTPNGVPVFTVSAAAADAPRDVSFASVAAPSSVFAGQSIRVRADLRHDGFDDEMVELHCKIGDEPEQVRKVALHEHKSARAEFTAKLTKQGVQRVRLWFPKVAGEASSNNNQAERWVKVVPERMKVLMVAGAPTWDYQYVRNALGRLSEVQLKDVVLEPGNQRLSLPAAEILSQDVILLFDVPVAALDEKRWDAVERVAQVAGGSVILVAGDTHLPTEEYYRYIPTATLLPFRAPFRPVWKVWPGDEPSFHFVPTPDGESLEFLKLPGEAQAPDADASSRRWEQLPGFFRFLQLPESHDKSWKPQARPLLVEEESRLPVLTEMRLGAGRAFFVGLTETWRWRMKVGERDQEHFWRQLVQHASEDPYFAHDGPLALDTDKVSAEPGEAIRVRARISEASAAANPAYTLQLLRDGKVVSEQPLVPTDPAGGGRFGASVSLPAGDYELRWTVTRDKGKTHTVKMPIHVGATSEEELADLSGDRRMLRKLAEASGGEFLTLEQVDRLPERLAAAGDARSRFAELRLWDSPYLFAIVVGCFGAEWALRKRVGLA